MNYDSKAQKWVFYQSPYFVRVLAASAYGWLQNRRRRGKHYHEHTRLLEESQWFSKDKLESFQFERTRAFLEYAQTHSKYYRRLFERHGFDPRAMASLGELRALPILDKDTARANMEDMVSDELDALDVRWSHTSGTTGHGLRFPESAACFQREFAARVSSIAWTGVEPGSKWAYCAGHPVAYHEATEPPFWVEDLLSKCLFMSSYHLTEANLPHYIGQLKRFKPDLLAGYPSSVYLLALANEHLGRPVRPRAVFTSSETLFDHQQRVIEDSFGCKAHSYYGNAERAAVIGQCGEGVYHVRGESSYVEFLDAAGDPTAPGEEARVICTVFGNYAMPLVRYDIGDVAILSARESCACGRGGVLLDRVVGRTEDYIVTPDGRLVGRLDHLFKDALNVRLAQIVQDKPEEVVFRVVRDSGYGEKDERVILDEARVRLGDQIGLRFEYVDDIPRTSNGKFRFILSRVAKKSLFDKTVDLVDES